MRRPWITGMKVRILGSAAGGGFPQWNCNCRGVRAGTLRARARTQSSIAVRAGDADRGSDGRPQACWVLINASPDILAQLRAHADFQPARTPRDTAISAIVLVDGQVDHTTGLYMLRESTRPWALWCTDAVYADLTRGNPIIEVLSHYCRIERRRMGLNGAGFAVETVPELRWHALPIAGKPAPYSPNRESPAPGDNVALLITDARSRKALFYAPGLAGIDEATWQAMGA